MALAFAALAPCVGGWAASFNAGHYNIRYNTLLDTGDYAWDTRKPYVVQTIRDFNYDVIGLNECNAGEMADYLQEQLTEYTYCVCGLTDDKALRDQFIHPILFRTSMFDLMDQGVFHLNLDLNASGHSWDCSNQDRTTHWAKLKVKATGEIFFFFITHLDHLGSDARNEQALINFNMVREIAGEYPAILCGDHNSAESRKPFYNLFSSYMQDCRYASATPFDWADDGTLNKWDPNNLSSTRIDFIWVRGFDVNTYNHINETFGRSVTPSDHFALITNLTYDKPAGNYESYVDPSASDGGDGSLHSPYNSLQTAIDNAAPGGYVYVAEGTLSDPGVTLDKSLTIQGGYTKNFANVTGETTISGNGENRCFYAPAQTFLELSDFNITDGYTTANGGGICCDGARLILDHVNISNCYAKKNGAGAYSAQQLLCDQCTFTANHADNNGGAFYTDYTKTSLWWRYALTHCRFTQNYARQGSAGYVAGYSWMHVLGNTFDSNEAIYAATLMLTSSSYDSQTCVANNTFVNNTVYSTSGAVNQLKGGSAMLINVKSDSPVALACNTIIGNREACGDTAPDDYYGAAIYNLSGKLYLNNNLVAGNISNTLTGAGDLYSDATYLGGYNCWSASGSTSVKQLLSDLHADSSSDALQRLCSMVEYSGTESDPTFIVDDFGGIVPTVYMRSTQFGSDNIACVPYDRFFESALNIDADLDLVTTGTITVDQNDSARRSDGTSTIGSIESGTQVNGISTPSVDSPGLDPYTPLYDLQGRCVGTLSDHPTLSPGLYLTPGRKILIQ